MELPVEQPGAKLWSDRRQTPPACHLQLRPVPWIASVLVPVRQKLSAAPPAFQLRRCVRAPVASSVSQTRAAPPACRVERSGSRILQPPPVLGAEAERPLRRANFAGERRRKLRRTPSFPHARGQELSLRPAPRPRGIRPACFQFLALASQLLIRRRPAFVQLPRARGQAGVPGLGLPFRRGRAAPDAGGVGLGRATSARGGDGGGLRLLARPERRVQGGGDRERGGRRGRRGRHRRRERRGR